MWLQGNSISLAGRNHVAPSRNVFTMSQLLQLQENAFCPVQNRKGWSCSLKKQLSLKVVLETVIWFAVSVKDTSLDC